MNDDTDRPVTRILLVADGDPSLASTNSGVALGLTNALSSMSEVEIVGAYSSRPGRLLRLLIVAMSIRPNLAHWRNASRKGRAATYVRSWLRDRALRRVDVDVIAVHVRNTYRPPRTRHRYVAFIDATGQQNQRGWDEWQLSRRDFARRSRTERVFFDQALAVVTATSTAARSVVDDYGVPAERVAVVGGGLNEAVSGTSTPPDPRPQCRRVLFVGKDFERKGGPDVVAAVALARERVADLELRIVGPERLELDLPGVCVVGSVTSTDGMAAQYAWADIFCMPSHHEPYGLAVQEALASGLPCIVSSVGVLPTLVDDGLKGSVVPTGAPAEIASVLVEYATDPIAWRAVCDRVRDSAPPSWNDVAARLVEAVR